MENLIEELTKVNQANLSEEGLKLFNKIMEIIDRNRELVDKCIELSTTIDALETDNKELEEELMQKDLMIIGLKENKRIAIEEIQEEYFISKSKVRKKIEEMEEEYNQFVEWDREDDCMITREMIETLEDLLQKGDKWI